MSIRSLISEILRLWGHSSSYAKLNQTMDTAYPFTVVYRNPCGSRVEVNGDGDLHESRYGVASQHGGPGIIGYRSVVITRDMVGKRAALFVGLQPSHPQAGRPDPEITAFIQRLVSAGGIGGVVRNPAETEALLGTPHQARNK